MSDKLKAYRAYDNGSYEDFDTVVFAKNVSEAKRLAMRTAVCECAEYINIRVNRLPVLDSCYRGKWEMDWEDPQDRIDLVKLANFICAYDIDLPECESCPAAEWCDRWANERNERGERDR